MTPEEIIEKRSTLSVAHLSKNLRTEDHIAIEKIDALWEIALQLAEMNARQRETKYNIPGVDGVPPMEKEVAEMVSELKRKADLAAPVKVEVSIMPPTVDEWS